MRGRLSELEKRHLSRSDDFGADDFGPGGDDFGAAILVRRILVGEPKQLKQGV